MVFELDEWPQNLNWDETTALFNMLRAYYLTEKPLPLDFGALCHLIGAESIEQTAAARRVRSEYFYRQADGYHSAQCDTAIALHRKQQAASRKANDTRWKIQRPSIPPELQAAADALDRNDPSMQVESSPNRTPNRIMNVMHHGAPKRNKKLIENPSRARGISEFMNSNTSLRLSQPANVAACARASGYANIQDNNPEILALLESGISESELILAITRARGKSWQWILAAAAGAHSDAEKARDRLPLITADPNEPSPFWAILGAKS